MQETHNLPSNYNAQENVKISHFTLVYVKKTYIVLSVEYVSILKSKQYMKAFQFYSS
jgi:hypothetical protein